MTKPRRLFRSLSTFPEGVEFCDQAMMASDDDPDPYDLAEREAILAETAS